MLKLYKQKELQNPIPFSIVYQILSAFVLVLIGCQAKLLKRVPTTQLLTNRNVIQLLIGASLKDVLNDKSPYYITDQVLCNKVYYRAILGTFNAVVYYYGLMMLSLSETIIISRTSPLWTAIIMTYILRRQKVSYMLLFQIMLCTFGIILVVKPPFVQDIFMNEIHDVPSGLKQESQHTLGVILLIIVAITFAIAQIILKDIGEKVSPFVVLHQQSIAIITVNALLQLTIGHQVTLSIYEFSMIASMALLGFIAQITLTKSFAIGNVTQVSLIGNIQVIFSLFFDFLILDSEIDSLSIMGTIIILGSLIFNALRK